MDTYKYFQPRVNVILICASFFIFVGGAFLVEYITLSHYLLDLTKNLCFLLIATGLAPTNGITPTHATLTRTWWKTISLC